MFTLGVFEKKLTASNSPKSFLKFQNAYSVWKFAFLNLDIMYFPLFNNQNVLSPQHKSNVFLVVCSRIPPHFFANVSKYQRAKDRFCLYTVWMCTVIYYILLKRRLRINTHMCRYNNTKKPCVTQYMSYPGRANIDVYFRRRNKEYHAPSFLFISNSFMVFLLSA